MKRIFTGTYLPDSSAVAHLASVKEGYTNTFRISAALGEAVDPVALQRALD